MKWIYLNNTNHIICYRFFYWLPGDSLEIPYSVPDDLGLTCLQEGTTTEPEAPSSISLPVEAVLNLTVNQLILEQCSIQLPYPCDLSQAVTLSLNGIALPRGSFWEVIHDDSLNSDAIAWTGLELQQLAQFGDSIIISYYRRLS